MHSAKTATLPPLRVEQQLKQSIERHLEGGETISSFVQDAIKTSLERRRWQAEFLKRAAQNKCEADASGHFVSATDVITKLERKVRAASNPGARKKK